MFSTIRFKAFFFVAVFALVLLAQTITQYLLTERLHDQASYLSDTQTRIIAQLHSMQIATIQIQQWLTDISATRGQDGLDDGFDEAAKSASQFQDALRELQRIDKKSGADYEALLPVMEAYYATGKKMATAYIEGGAPAGNKIMAEFDTTAAAIYDRIDKINEQIVNNQQEQFDLQLTEADQTRNMNMLFSLVYLLLLFAALFGILRFILTPTHKILFMAKNLAHGEGDLTQRMKTEGRHELSQLAREFNAFIARTDEMVSQVTKSVVRLIPMATELADTNKDIKQASLVQLKTSRQVSEFMDQTRKSSRDVAEHIRQISDFVKQGVVSLDSGQQVARETIQGMDQLSLEIRQISEAITRLREDSYKIESIIDVINSISEQTNLLALNAAIEAARAGEAGRGFAVVADEVRTLATRTKQSTIEVQSMIQSIQNSTLQAANSMEKGTASTQHSVDQVNKSAEMLRELAATMTEIDNQAENIAQENHQQEHSFHTVSESIQMMDVKFNKTLTHLESNLSFGDDLTTLSNKLRGLIGKFKVTDTNWSMAQRSKDRPSNVRWLQQKSHGAHRDNASIEKQG
ncbi:MAG: methyl-accepting chemotaxis protein [Gammaproteobacteria bacterium]|nr:methyl-accepting chemotaxis protein [Gammaproteobacteria bacterium]